MASCVNYIFSLPEKVTGTAEDGEARGTFEIYQGQYLETKDEIREGADKLFEKIKLGNIKVKIYKKYKLEDVVQAHKDLEARKIIGPAIIIP